MRAVQKLSFGRIAKNKGAVKKGRGGAGANKKYKDSVFTKLFKEPSKILELYNAIEGASYGEDTEIKITTLSGALYTDRINDLSFTIDGKIVVLIEHQSTVNGNMPLRMLFYISRIYEKITGENEDNVYREKMITIPRPEFTVLYNGEEDMPDVQILKLSDLFAGYGGKNRIALELEVKVLNINRGRNPEIAAKSATLNDYEIFVSTVREYKERIGDLDKAIRMAVDECIKRDVLKEFLKSNASEVRNMLYHKWNLKKALEVRGKEAFEDGVQKGVQNLTELLENGVSLNDALKQLGVDRRKTADVANEAVGG